MSLNLADARRYLAAFEFKPLFIEGLGWNHHGATLEIAVDGESYTLSAVAEKCGMAAFVCGPGHNGRIPAYPVRRRIERQVARSAHEHLIIFTGGKPAAQVWQWVRRGHGKPAVCREHPYHIGQPGDSLVQKLHALAVSLEEEDCLTLPDVTGRARKAFDIERITKRFYDRFKDEHAAFHKFLGGIPDKGLERWYVSVMLNRLMFVYFIQKKGFLDGDRDYLKNKLTQCKKELGKDRYYRNFLCPLFFEGFAKKGEERSDKAGKFLGDVPYLNGGIFMPHQIEQLYGRTIEIPDRAFERLFEFFDAYHWHLDERPLKRDDEINPDVLGYIFEKYINQKQMGAYYTKEDITEYIGKNTVIPSLFDTAREKCKVAFEGERSIWRLLSEDPDRYIYPAVRHGVKVPLPPDIAEGLDTRTPGLLERRKGWNKPAPAEYALPTEIWREVLARRTRHDEVRSRLAAGDVHSTNDLITYNLDIRQFAQDVIENAEGPELLMAFWKAIESVTVLDPTCGSGAFLFAALNILDPLYEACLERMRFFLEEWGEKGRKNHPNYHKLFTETLKRMDEHPNYRYFILKSVIVNNLYGVDIMEEAVEICRLRLFLKLVAQIERVENLEPLPDIDFNIRSGNTLVGFADLAEIRDAAENELKRNVEGARQGLLLLGDKEDRLRKIEEEAEIADRAFQKFHEMQTAQGMSPKDFSGAKEDLRARLRKLTDELDRFLAMEYDVDMRKIRAFEKWRKSHQPFHWFAEFYGILKTGGF
ncbi:MAG: DNA methyltransferase, partial [Chlamydiota bacterium]